MKAVMILSLMALLLLSGCAKPSVKENTIATECVALCQNALKEGRDLSKGPCLSDGNPNWNVDNWVCDVAHSPRQAVDNQRENQCNEWWEGYNKSSPPKFVEVDPSCEFIKTG